MTLVAECYEPSKMLIDSSRTRSHLHLMAANNSSICHRIICLSRAIAKPMKLNIIAITAWLRETELTFWSPLLYVDAIIPVYKFK